MFLIDHVPKNSNMLLFLVTVSLGASTQAVSTKSIPLHTVSAFALSRHSNDAGSVACAEHGSDRRARVRGGAPERAASHPGW